jgi:hypothetical protein
MELNQTFLRNSSESLVRLRESNTRIRRYGEVKSILMSADVRVAPRFSDNSSSQFTEKLEDLIQKCRGIESVTGGESTPPITASLQVDGCVRTVAFASREEASLFYLRVLETLDVDVDIQYF